MIKKIEFEITDQLEKEIELDKTQYEAMAEALLENYLTRLLKQNNDDILMEG